MSLTIQHYSCVTGGAQILNCGCFVEAGVGCAVVGGGGGVTRGGEGLPLAVVGCDWALNE